MKLGEFVHGLAFNATYVAVVGLRVKLQIPILTQPNVSLI